MDAVGLTMCCLLYTSLVQPNRLVLEGARFQTDHAAPTLEGDSFEMLDQLLPQSHSPIRRADVHPFEFAVFVPVELKPPAPGRFPVHPNDKKRDPLGDQFFDAVALLRFGRVSGVIEGGFEFGDEGAGFGGGGEGGGDGNPRQPASPPSILPPPSPSHTPAQSAATLLQKNPGRGAESRWVSGSHPARRGAKSPAFRRGWRGR